jgi:hypothetical protein
MACDECSKCWFNYIEECEGQEDYKEDACKKKGMVDNEDEGEGESQDDDNSDAHIEIEEKNKAL